MIGNEGLAGVTLVMGGATTTSRVMVQSKGQIYRLRCEILGDEFGRGGALQQLLLRFTNALLTQISQTAVCNRRHSIDQQLCRWLLLSLDRLGSDELTMTHEVSPIPWACSVKESPRPPASCTTPASSITGAGASR